jgi:transposase
MVKRHPMELRTRVVAFFDEGHGHREAARQFRVSPKLVNDLVKLRRETGSLGPQRQGNGRSDRPAQKRRLVLVPSAVFARPEPHGNGVRQAEDTGQESRRANI